MIRVARCFVGRFARDDDTFPDGYDHLDESQARVSRESRLMGATVSNTM